MQATRYQHIVLNEQSVPEILGSTMKVLELVLSQKAFRRLELHLLRFKIFFAFSKFSSST